MKVIATSDNVVVKIKKVESKTSNGLYLPDGVGPESFLRGEITSIGPMVEDPNLKIGDLIAFSEHGGQVMLSRDKDLLTVLKYGEIYCVIDE